MSEKIQDQSWIDAQDVKFVDNLKQLIEGFQIAIRQNTLMVQLFNEYGMTMHSIFETTMATENDNVSNTNFPEPANRSERRAEVKRQSNSKPKIRKTPFEAVKK